MNVLVIPEDFRKDQYALKPLVEAMMAAVGRPRARVLVCRDPLLGGVAQALRWERIEEILEQYRGMVDLFLLVVDRDGDAGRRTRLDELENLALESCEGRCRFLAENAWQELEIFLLAGQDLPVEWAVVREEVSLKETYFLPYVRQRRLMDHPGEGRGTLAREAASRYGRLLRLCPEDWGSLHQRVQAGL